MNSSLLFNRLTKIAAALALLTASNLALSQADPAELSSIHRTDQIEVELVAETTNVVPGETLWLAIRLDPIDHWHTYWKFGGDSGVATEASDWTLPDGAEVGDIVWPTPEWTPFLGSELVTFTYEREVLLPLPIAIPADFDGSSFALETTVDWQVCEEICIPGSARLALSLPVAAQAEIDANWQQAFAETRASTPRTLDSHALSTHFNVHDNKINVMIQAADALFADVDEAWFFPDQKRVMKYAPFRKVMKDGDRLQIATEQHRRFDQTINELNGVLAFVNKDGSQHAYDIKPQRSNVAWDHSIEVELLSESVTAVAGETLWLGLRLDAAEHWHTYWKMGGDSGEPTQMSEWQAPEGTAIGEIQWPAPHWLPFYETDLVNFGYENEIVLPVAVTLPETLEADENGNIELSTLAFWNVCEQICIPGEQRLSITLPVAEQQELDASVAPLFARARAQLPQTDHDIKSLFAVAGERVSLGFESSELRFDDFTDAWFFPDQRRVVKYGPLRDVTLESNFLQITHNQPRRMVEDLSTVFGVLVMQREDGERVAYDFSNPAADASSTVIAPLLANNNLSGAGDTGPGAGTPIEGNLLTFMFFALVGGLVLNLMPCVFPVLSLKAMSFAANAGASVQRQRMDGLVYTAGVLVAFVLLAATLMILRAGGERIGWGFQLQQPWFLALIVYVFFTMGLSLSGVFEIGTGMMGVGSGLAQQKGYKGSFFTGVLTTVVATPCTAPLMGPALGFALTQSPAVGMLVFLALGLGVALPILILSFIPALARHLPKPGAWMETFKQFMAFPMYAAALFFLWVLGNQVGNLGVALVGAACILLAFAAWLYQMRLRIGTFWRRSNAVMATLSIVGAIYVVQSPFLETAPVAVAAVDSETGLVAGTNYEVFSTQRLNELQADSRPVFVNMTATWCIPCLANEQTTLSKDNVKQSLLDNGITYMKGDWTNEDPEITAILEQFNRPSVPLYILYPGDQSKEPVILPQILTPGIAIDAFESI